MPVSYVPQTFISIEGLSGLMSIIVLTGVQLCLPEIETSSFMMAPSSYKDGPTVVAVIGSKESRLVLMGMSFQLPLHGHEIHADDRGHVWYAVDDDDMTEKVSPKSYPGETRCKCITALLFLEVVDY